VPAGWFIVLSVVACVGAAGWLGVMLIGPTTAAESASSTTSPTLSPPSPAASTAPPATATPSPAPAETKAETEAKREAPVAVLNNTGIKNLAKTFSTDVQNAGWDVAGLGNWRGQIVSNTVYYPDGLRDQADVLAADVGIERVLPSIVPMRMDRLTIILSGPQE
jgi:hypothetical protein